MLRKPSTWFAIVAITAVSLASASDAQPPLTAEESELARLLNEYRQQSGLAAVPVTSSLTKVARLHVGDLNQNHPDTKTYGQGECNMHSWSDKGEWTAVCYSDSDSTSASKMWGKPRELTETYRGNGYEISFIQMGADATPNGAVNQWKNSQYHNETILQIGMFAGVVWNAMGVGITGNYAVVWFGEEVDPAGVVPTEARPPSPTPAPVPLTLEPRREEFRPGESIRFVLRNVTPKPVPLTDCRYIILKEKNGDWLLYFKATERFKTPTIKPHQELEFDWPGRHVDGHPATSGRYRIEFETHVLGSRPLRAEFRLR